MFPTYEKLDDVIAGMKSFGEFLMPYNFPRVSPTDEDEVNGIKSRETTIDGFNLTLYYSKADWKEHYLEILQISGKYTPFLPFSLVCKIGKKFLGEKYLSYVDFTREGKKVYCWTVVLDRSGNPINGPYKADVENCIYEGFNYTMLNPSKVNFY